MLFNIQERKLLFLQRRNSRRKPERTTNYLKAYVLHKDKTPVLREAYALSAFWLNAELELFPEELIAGKIHADEPVMFHYGCGTWCGGGIWSDVTAGITEADISSVLERSYRYIDPVFINEREMAHIDAHASTSTWFGGHMVLDYEIVLTTGLQGYRDRIEKHRKTCPNGNNDFYLAMDITLDGIIGFILRFADLADSINPDSKLGAVLRHIAVKPPETFHQALQLVWILHYLDNSDSFGRFDRYLDPFYRNNLGDKELLTDFWLKIEDAEQIQNMTIGGTDETGHSAYSDLTYLCLEVTRELGFKGPNLCLRVTPDIPAEIWNAAMECISTGLGQPALYNDDIYMQSLIRSGIPVEMARNYCFAGCSQLMIPGMSNFYNDIGMFNTAKIFELTLYNGFDPRTGEQVGPLTGSDFKNFNEFKNAFYRQLNDACDIQIELHNKELHYRAQREGYALRSLFTRDCLETGKGIFEGGARYNNVQLELIGITNAADSLYAVQKAVFEDKKITFSGLLEALRANWEGYDELHSYIRSLPKFGNDEEAVDSLRVEVTDFLYDRFNREPGPLGGVYVPGEVIFTAHDACGSVTGATPDGRKAGEVLADSAGAASGCIREGPTALMNSVLTLPVQNYLLTSVVLNMRFLPESFNTPDARNKVSTLFRSFFAQGGMQLQINVCGSDDLIKAQKNPELYGDLTVRVGGYSDYFVRLSKTLQDEIIARTAF